MWWPKNPISPMLANIRYQLLAHFESNVTSRINKYTSIYVIYHLLYTDHGTLKMHYKPEPLHVQAITMYTYNESPGPKSKNNPPPSPPLPPAPFLKEFIFSCPPQLHIPNHQFWHVYSVFEAHTPIKHYIPVHYPAPPQRL